ncbi:MAG: acyl-CoA dehydrogenase family protein, partial [Planctomycetales bacterium]|nr:acyl-CoA dehydrogenase family protein [Planctomycetales bacterium]
MDFSIPASTVELLQRVREFIQVELIPLERALSGRRFLEILPELMAKRELVKQLGLWLPQIPSEYGGVGLGFLDYAMVCEQLARSPYGNFVFNAQAPDAGNMEILIEFGSQQQQRRWLRPLLDGKIRSCFSMTEPDRPGSNPVWMETTA